MPDKDTAANTDSNHLDGDELDQALAASLIPPTLPLGFRASLMAAIAHDAAIHAEHKRQALEAEHAADQARLRAGYVRLRREALAWGLTIAFVAGAAASVILPWLAMTLQTDVAGLAPYAAAGVALLIAGLVWQDRWGWSGDS